MAHLAVEVHITLHLTAVGRIGSAELVVYDVYAAVCSDDHAVGAVFPSVRADDGRLGENARTGSEPAAAGDGVQALLQEGKGFRTGIGRSTASGRSSATLTRERMPCRTVPRMRRLASRPTLPSAPK